jgi:hypothetical protein
LNTKKFGRDRKSTEENKFMWQVVPTVSQLKICLMWKMSYNIIKYNETEKEATNKKTKEYS